MPLRHANDLQRATVDKINSPRPTRLNRIPQPMSHPSHTQPPVPVPCGKPWQILSPIRRGISPSVQRAQRLSPTEVYPH